MTEPTLDEWLAAHGEEFIAFRRRLHMHPELSGEEHHTTEVLGERLRVGGLEARVFSSGTGLCCDIGEAPRVALRADIDALAMDDEKDVSYRSQVPGVAHACGHDVHTTITLAAGLYLAHHGLEPGQGLRLIFQPAEELLPGGAVGVIDDGGLDEVEAVLGLHCDPKLDVGRVGLRAGAITSAADMARITVHGPGGHTARPEETVDMIPLLARIVTDLPDRVRSRFDDDAPLKFVFGSVRAGDAANVIPATARLAASIRTPRQDIWELLPAIVEAEALAIIEPSGAECSIDYVSGVPPVLNDPTMVDVVRASVSDSLGADVVTEAIQSWGGDDFAWYGQQVPAAYIRLGTHDPSSTGPRLDLHAGHFDVDERAIAVGVRVLVAAARRLLEDRDDGTSGYPTRAQVASSGDPRA